MTDSARTILVEGLDAPGVLASVAGVFARRETNIAGIQTLRAPKGGPRSRLRWMAAPMSRRWWRSSDS